MSSQVLPVGLEGIGPLQSIPDLPPNLNLSDIDPFVVLVEGFGLPDEQILEPTNLDGFEDDERIVVGGEETMELEVSSEVDLAEFLAVDSS